ncbi:MAG TPA: hypothetical protein PL033_13700 [Candidatus Brocadiia bacterium]|nr:hypothetical protein [Candidatus Brocadiia bacterium]
METHCITITSPWDGDVLNRHDGIESDTGLTVCARGTCPSGASVHVNGVPASVEGEAFTCRIGLTERESAICAVGRLGDRAMKDEIRVMLDLRSRPRYRFSVDDNIEFLRDLGTNPSAYTSIFDHFYMAFWRRMHDEFGAKIHINIYFQSIHGPFTLRQMPDKWKGEWQSCAEWLRLTFHAHQDTPARPYKDASRSQMAADYELVTNEIRRFAGAELVSDFTTVHWAEAPKDACRALSERGVKGLIALFGRNRDNECNTGYYLDERVKDHANCRDCWHDFETGLTFVTCDAVVNGLALEAIEPHIERQAASPHTGEMMELLIHEQYFRKELQYHQPDVQDKVIRALEWVTKRGYEPVHWDEGFLGNRG